MGNGHASSRQTQDDDIAPTGVVSQSLGQLPTRIGSISKLHLELPSMATNCIARIQNVTREGPPSVWAAISGPFQSRFGCALGTTLAPSSFSASNRGLHGTANSTGTA
jgi:hypothetical protein